MNNKKLFAKIITLGFVNLAAVIALFLLLVSPFVISTNIIRFDKDKNLILGTTDVFDYGNLVKAEKINNNSEIIRVTYIAFPKTSSIYENVAYVKNESQTSKNLQIFSQSSADAELFFNLGGQIKPKTVVLSPGQVVYTSLVVGSSAQKLEEQKTADFAIIDY